MLGRDGVLKEIQTYNEDVDNLGFDDLGGGVLTTYIPADHLAFDLGRCYLGGGRSFQLTDLLLTDLQLIDLHILNRYSKPG